jgi:hypothetical protein
MCTYKVAKKKKSMSTLAPRFLIGLLVCLLAWWISWNQLSTQHVQVSQPSECAAPSLYTSDSCLQKCIQKSLATILFPKPLDTIQPKVSCHSCPHYNGSDTIFEHISQYLQGTVLDAGTGPSSLQFLAQLQASNQIQKVTAITASKHMYDHIQSIPLDRDLKLGTWSDLSLNDQFDSVLVDYLIGSMDAFSPYTQHLIFHTLKRYLKKSGKIIVVGWEPMVDEGITEGDHLLLAARNLEMSCMLLSKNRLFDEGKGRLYREFPRQVIEDYMTTSGIRITHRVSFPIVYGKPNLKEWLDGCEYYLEHLEGNHARSMAVALRKRIAELHELIYKNQELEEGLCFGMDYVLVGELE